MWFLFRYEVVCGFFSVMRSYVVLFRYEVVCGSFPL